MAIFSSERVQKAIDEATKLLGYSELRANQAQVVSHFLSGRDVFVSLPTGGGKSLCYCLLPKAFDILRGTSSCTKTQSIAIVVSPLVSLMIDQVRHITERNVSAVYVGDCKSEEDVCNGVYQLVFLCHFMSTILCHLISP